MPRLWNDTIAAHKRDVHNATLDAAAALIATRGLRSVTMSQIAEDTGIGRATLYKYFPDVETILTAWHDREVSAHLARLAEVRAQAGSAGEQLEAVLHTYALISYDVARRDHGAELTALLHRGRHVARAHRRLWSVVRDILAEAAKDGAVRDDVAPDELASFCLHALSAVGGCSSKTAVRRLVAVTLAGLRSARD